MEDTKAFKRDGKERNRRGLPVIDCDVHNTLSSETVLYPVPLRALASASSDVGRT